MPDVQQFVFDARLPVGDSMNSADPAHPRNVMRNAAIVQNQALADTKYDIYPPPRVEAFTAAVCNTDGVMLGLSVLAGLAAIIAVFYIQHKVMRVVCIAVAIMSIHYAIGKLEKCTEYMLAL